MRIGTTKTKAKKTARDRLSRRALCTAAAAAALSSAAPARANGRFPASNQLFFSPSDPQRVILRTTFGILLSADAGRTWSWLCEEALGLSSASIEDPSVGVTLSGTLVAGTSVTLETSPDNGCSWQRVGGALAHKAIVDVAVRPNDAHGVVVIQSSYTLDAGAGGGAGFATQVVQSTDDGATWAPMGVPIDPSVTPETIDVAATDPHRLYVSGHRAPATPTAAATASLFVSTDDGAHWTERPLPPLDAAQESAVFIAAVDPSSADTVYLRSGQTLTGAPSSSRLFVTRDAGQSFRVVAQLAGPMLGFALSPDGATLYLGGPQDGLLVGPTAGLDASNPFHETSSIHVQCLAAHGTDLWACSDEASGFLAGVSTNGGACFAPRLHEADIQTPIECTGDAAAAQCSGDPFQMLCGTFDNCPDPDAGDAASAASGDGGLPGCTVGATGDAGGSDGGSTAVDAAAPDATAGASPPPAGGGGSTGASSGCAAGGGAGAAGLLASLFAFALLGLRRSRAADARGRRRA